MSRNVTVELGERSYDILVGSGVWPGAALADIQGRSALLVTDSHVDPLYGDACMAHLEACGTRAERAVVPAGEATKSLDTVRSLYDAALAAGLDRRSLIVALGGGMVGDLAGFVAATYLRGIRFLAAPTSLVAMVDSAVGGKTAVNLPQGKNLVGAFHQPIEVAADPSRLATLPEREYVSGLAEVVKYGIVWDAVFFEELERHVQDLCRRDARFLERVVARCCEIKAEIVALDERETGVRAVLNFGHTLAHAVEKTTGYGTWLHGEAVAAGMAFAALASSRIKSFPAADTRRICAILKRLKLPTAVEGVTWEALYASMATDKKARDGAPRFVLAERLGGVAFDCPVDVDLLRDVYGEMRRIDA